jgi:hypothetical protein
MLRIDDKTGSSDLRVCRVLFLIFRKIFLFPLTPNHI